MQPLRRLGLAGLRISFLASCATLSGGATTQTPPISATSVAPAADTATTTATPTTSTTITTTLPPSTTTTTLGTTSTVAPTTTSTIPATELEAGLFCRDLAADAYPYEETVRYWLIQGSPNRMDADRNGIPCETLYAKDLVLAYWGDPLPTTTAVNSPYLVGTPTYAPAPLPGSRGAAGSGCSPGTSTLPDGVWFGYIAEATRSQISLDLACYRPDPEADEGADITNSNPRLRTVKVASDALAYQVVGYDGLEWIRMPYRTFLETPPDDILCSLAFPCASAWLYVNGGVVTEYVQLFWP